MDSIQGCHHGNNDYADSIHMEALPHLLTFAHLDLEETVVEDVQLSIWFPLLPRRRGESFLCGPPTVCSKRTASKTCPHGWYRGNWFGIRNMVYDTSRHRAVDFVESRNCEDFLVESRNCETLQVERKIQAVPPDGSVYECWSCLVEHEGSIQNCRMWL